MIGISGARMSVSYSTLASCASRGWLALDQNADEKRYGKITDAGRALPCLSEEGAK